MIISPGYKLDLPPASIKGHKICTFFISSASVDMKNDSPLCQSGWSGCFLFPYHSPPAQNLAFLHIYSQKEGYFSLGKHNELDT